MDDRKHINIKYKSTFNGKWGTDARPLQSSSPSRCMTVTSIKWGEMAITKPFNHLAQAQCKGKPTNWAFTYECAI